MKIYAITEGIFFIAMLKSGCGPDQMSWQEFLKLLPDVFAYAAVQTVVYTLEQKRVSAISAKGDAEFCVDDQK